MKEKIVRAQHGYFVLTYQGDRNYEKHPIVAWKIKGWQVIPISIAYAPKSLPACEDDVDGLWVLMPNNEVCQLGGSGHDIINYLDQWFDDREHENAEEWARVKAEHEAELGKPTKEETAEFLAQHTDEEWAELLNHIPNAHAGDRSADRAQLDDLGVRAAGALKLQPHPRWTDGYNSDVKTLSAMYASDARIQHRY